MQQLLAVFLVVVVIGVGFLLMRERPMFVIDIEDGRAVVRSGKAPSGFLRECEAIVSMHDIPDGSISVSASGSRVSFAFSNPGLRAYEQNFRNVWYAIA